MYVQRTSPMGLHVSMNVAWSHELFNEQSKKQEAFVLYR